MLLPEDWFTKNTIDVNFTVGVWHFNEKKTKQSFKNWRLGTQVKWCVDMFEPEIFSFPDFVMGSNDSAKRKAQLTKGGVSKRNMRSDFKT